MTSGYKSRETKTPFRNVDRADSRQLVKRAWWIIALNLFVPGSAQVVAGNKRFGRLGILFTLGFWIFLAVLALVAVLSRVTLFTVMTTPFIATPLGIALAVYAILIALSTLDALRLMYVHRITSRTKALLVILVLVTGAFNTFVVGTIGSTVQTSAALSSTIFKNSGSLEPTKGRYNILLLGGDSGANRIGLRPDSISILSVSAETGNAVSIGLPRNLTNIHFREGTPIHSVYPNGFNSNCGGECFLNAVYKAAMDNYKDLYPGISKKGSTAGIEATKSAVEWVTGLKIHGYVLINMKSFVGLVDALGGVTVNVKKALPIGGQQDCWPADNEHGSICPDALGWIEKGRQHMDGKTALWYARSRHNTDDYDRMRRQREVMQLVLKKIDPQTLLLKLGPVAAAGAKLIQTDIPNGSIGTFIDLALKARSKGLKSLQLTKPTIQADNPDFWLIRHLIAEKNRKFK